MAYSETTIDGIGLVRIFRRKGLKHLRISIDRNGKVRLSVPWYVPKSAGLRYLQSKKAWIEEHQKLSFPGWADGQIITRSHSLAVHETASIRASSRLAPDKLHIFVPSTYGKDKKQEIIKNKIKAFLRTESERLLIPKVNEIALQHSIKTRSVTIKNLKSRWGSCDSHGNITLSSLLTTLEDNLVEYVICHELAHTQHMNHSKEFWLKVEMMVPDYKQRRKDLRKINSAGIL
ncbi:MAG TPA: SprT family zinc-dependent metalloprotease [Patescibacteria group bacterium]|nr:SprT family zinc-dependent metalloprotease [Patescibacteria group bacterium]